VKLFISVSKITIVTFSSDLNLTINLNFSPDNYYDSHRRWIV